MALSFCHEHAEALGALLSTRSTQTNEVNRCAALLPALVHAVPAARAIALVELGASAGLNLLLDRYAYRYTGEAAAVRAGQGPVRCESAVDGTLPSLAACPLIAQRVGVDLDPVDVHDEDAVRWLTACVFADQPWRVQRLLAAVQFARRRPPTIIRGDATTLLRELDGDRLGGAHPVVWHSLVLGYFLESEQHAFTEALDGAGAAMDLTWIYLETPAETPGLPTPQSARRIGGIDCALVAVSYRDGRRAVRQLARADAHLARLSWLASAEPSRVQPAARARWR